MAWVSEKVPHRPKNRRAVYFHVQLPLQIEKLIVELKREQPSWGAPKIREKLGRRYSNIQIPAISTVHAVLDRHGLVKHGRKRRYKAQGTTLSKPTHSNDLWCADYKSEFMLADMRYCYPLTISDFASRYLLSFYTARRRSITSCLSGLRVMNGVGVDRRTGTRRR
jgi:putative transposase